MQRIQEIVLILSETIVTVWHAGLAPQPARNIPTERKLIALASGLAVGEPSADAPRLLLLLDWLKGILGDTRSCQQVARLVICGETSSSCVHVVCLASD
jgi:hypothetical protein